jgi:hypothetical protein
MKERTIQCEYQPYIARPPVRNTRELYNRAASADEPTIASFGQQWLDHIKANREKFGPFKNKCIGNLFGKYLHRPVIVAGSGPSLKFNADQLKNRGSIPLVSCLHNFQYFMDKGIKTDYWVTLDSQLVTVEEVSEGGQLSPEEYWAKTEGQVLLAYIGTHPELLERWRGEIYFYNSPMPDPDLREKIADIEVFNNWVSSGGNVLGAAMYIAKAYFGAGATVFVGADFSFGYDKKFHSWDSKYDRSMGNYIHAVDVFGHKVPTWPSYNNFKSFFDYVACEVPGIYINCSEGGTLGAYPDGNLMAIKQMDLDECLRMYNMSDLIKTSALSPDIGSGEDATEEEKNEGRKILY